MFINLGCNINEQDQRGHTIFTKAIQKNSLILIDFIKNNHKSFNFNFNVVDKEGKTYIHHVVSPMRIASYENTQLLKYLSKHINVDQRDFSNKPAIYYAMQQKS